MILKKIRYNILRKDLSYMQFKDYINNIFLRNILRLFMLNFKLDFFPGASILTFSIFLYYITNSRFLYAKYFSYVYAIKVCDS